MVVRIKPDSTDSANYEIAVYQHDLDGDRPIYTRPIVLNGSGQASTQRFWMYFLPQPIEKGLPDKSTGSLHALQRDLQVFLCKPGNPPKPIVELPLTSQLQNVDPFQGGYSQRPRSTKLILAVSARGAQPTLTSADYNKISNGVLEDVTVVNLRPEDLPEDPIGYEAVDAVIWLDGNPADLQGGNLDSFAALKDYVRFGGHLVICQSANNWQEDQSFGDLLPVDVTGIDNKSNFEPLLSMAKPNGPIDPLQPLVEDSWWRSKGPYQMARSTARPGTVVDKWIDWKQDKSNTDATPYLARKAYGLGEVTWLAQQLTADICPMNPTGWPYVWDQVMGWKNISYNLADRFSADDPKIHDRLALYHPGGPSDLGYPFSKGLDSSSRANWLILLAIFFFIVYWLVAGPGSYVYLVTKKRQAMSWFFFGIAALAATGVTVLVVKLVLRGPPEVHHVSFVRIAPGQPAYIHSRFGLYIPRDGDQKISLSDTANSSVSYLSPYAMHPQQLGGDVTEFPSPTDYYVPVRDLKSDTPPELTVAYRSSAKKFQARWIGEWTNRITGAVKLDPANGSLHLAGTITNTTGMDLTDIFLAFTASDANDYMIYFPTWNKGDTKDFARDFVKPYKAGKEGGLEGKPGDGKIICDRLQSTANGWADLWADHFRRSPSDDPNIGDTDMNYLYPLLSVWDRLPAIPNTQRKQPYSGKVDTADDRVELFNRGVRMLNASASVASGQMLILASGKGPVPMPLNVDDVKMQGDGLVFYQFILPIDRGKMDTPTTRPAGK